MTISRLALVPMALCLATIARAEGPSLATIDLARIDPEVPHAFAEQIAQDLSAQLAKKFALMPRSEIDALRTGAEKSPDVSAATAAIAEAKQLILNFSFKQASRKLKEA